MPIGIRLDPHSCAVNMAASPKKAARPWPIRWLFQENQEPDFSTTPWSDPIIPFLVDRVVPILLVVIVGYVLMSASRVFVRGIVKALMDREATEGTAQELSAVELTKRMDTLDQLGSNVLRFFVVIIVGLMVLNNLGLNIGPAIAGLGVGALALGATLIINAGLAYVSALEEMDIGTFRKLERVNVEGTLLLLTQAGKFFRLQNIGGDIVLVSTKNVFAPGAKFGAYSATKAAAHQLCRIASLEFAEMGVRVNMVAPDAVFAHGEKKSGLWAQVGPDRMKARGLDEKGLEEYYRTRNLLKARVTADHVANAVLFFATRQTPTTGATIPVDGGLPDATPR